MRWCLLISLLVLTHLHGDGNMKEKSLVVVIETTQGNVEIALMPEVAPKACQNLIELAKKKYYDGITLHRIIKGFMIQGGDPTGTGAGGSSVWGKEFEDEVSSEVKFDKPGLLAMANRGPNTNGSQFFITTAPTPWLHKKHTIFGQVTEGYDIIQKLESTRTDGMDRPIETQKILRMYIKE
ncbi:MAG: peptidylprolyl isomerase [Simkaniaceae bacterium]|nr:peptidylprolyl isomerase [Simkaniaceae bacterium]